jgi:hypothetical protein
VTRDVTWILKDISVSYGLLCYFFLEFYKNVKNVLIYYSDDRIRAMSVSIQHVGGEKGK